MAKTVMTNTQYVDTLKHIASIPTVYKNKFPYNCGYYDGVTGRFSFDCWNLVKSVINKEKPAVSFAEARDLCKALQAEDVKMICLTDSLGALTSGLDERETSQTITANMMLKGHAEEFGIPVVDGGTEYIEELKSELDHSER